jgi:hypothetical protein
MERGLYPSWMWIRAEVVFAEALLIMGGDERA